MIHLQNKFLGPSSDSFVGIDMGNLYLKGLIVKEGKVSDYFMEKKEVLSEALKKIWIDKKISERKVKISLKDPACLIRYFPFPKMEKKRLKEALFYEMSKFIPFSPEEVYYDYFVLKENNPSELMILLAVAKKDFLDGILEDLKKINLKVSEITLDSVCLINFFLDNYKENLNANACILDIGYKFSAITILNKGVPFLTRDIKFSAQDIFQVISRTQNIQICDVQEWLKASKNGQLLSDIVQDSLSNLSKEIKSSFDYFEVNKGGHIDSLYVSGGLSGIDGMSKALSDFLEVKINVLEAIPVSQDIFSPSFSRESFQPIKHGFPAVFGLIS
ncbi:MAG: pilus assembly protein PilM [Candidatus Omnitrophica bacterium]|nr:pilus assembly protein PilM [Candidatus Omnitrophota bacterium]MDD5429968.1 pilus assembly protein PilM [Candidatus Omnitrophota bacterium]